MSSDSSSSSSFGSGDEATLRIRRIGKYALLEFLGGGMSRVYRAQDTVIGRPVVVKILTGESSADPNAHARFLHEARIAGQFQHENIVSVFDFGEHEGHPYIVMEYLQGEDLRNSIRGGRAGSLYERLKIARDIARALHYVHERGTIHRDIKPENIHIDLNGRVKLMDFGIAKAMNMSLTRTGMALGTPFYMAPEQVAGSANSSLVDIYAFGMLFYELLTGERGITGETIEQVFFQVLNQPLDDIKLQSTGAPPEIRDLILRCTAKAAEKRPQSLLEVITALDGVLNQTSGSQTLAMTARLPEQIPAPVPSAPRSSRKLAVGLAAVAAMLAISVAVVRWTDRPRGEGSSRSEGMIYVPAGSFLFGPDKMQVTLPAFYIDETEVTNADFSAFCRATGCADPRGAADLPVVNVPVAEARAFARWKGKRLPTDLEWERAARGSDGAGYPWGNTDDPAHANLGDNPSLSQHELMPVRSFEAQPAYQMIGNAWEMVEANITPSESAVNNFLALLTPAPTAQEKWIEIRGGSFTTPIADAVAYKWSPIPERFAARNIGFRCAKDP